MNLFGKIVIKMKNLTYYISKCDQSHILYSNEITIITHSVRNSKNYGYA